MPRKHVIVGGERFNILLRERQIQHRIKELAGEINKDYAGKNPVIICVLNGAFLFYADLVRHLTIDCEISFLPISSYGDHKTSSGKVELLAAIPRTLKGRDVLVVEDVVDSGNTVRFLQKTLRQLKVRSFQIISLLYKNDTANNNVTIRYIGFRIPKHFVIGYGLDLAQKMRNLRDIYALADHTTSQRTTKTNGRK